jgi:hypothetical protein
MAEVPISRSKYTYVCIARKVLVGCKLLLKGKICAWGNAVACWLRHYATKRKVAGSIPDEVNF